MTPEVLPAFWIIIKVLALIGLAIYSGFAAVIVRQEQLMADVLEEGFEPILRLLAIIHLVAAIGIFILAALLL